MLFVWSATSFTFICHHRISRFKQLQQPTFSCYVVVGDSSAISLGDKGDESRWCNGNQKLHRKWRFVRAKHQNLSGYTTWFLATNFWSINDHPCCWVLLAKGLRHCCIHLLAANPPSPLFWYLVVGIQNFTKHLWCSWRMNPKHEGKKKKWRVVFEFDQIKKNFLLLWKTECWWNVLEMPNVKRCLKKFSFYDPLRDYTFNRATRSRKNDSGIPITVLNFISSWSRSEKFQDAHIWVIVFFERVET